MAKKTSGNRLGVWAFTIGVLAAIVLGAFGSLVGSAGQQWLAVLLVVLGIVVGVLNVTGDEAMSFLTTTAILVFVSFAGAQAFAVVWTPLVSVFNSLMLLFVPATIVVALRVVWTLARD